MLTPIIISLFWLLYLSDLYNLDVVFFREKEIKKTFYFWFTDLSVAGLPAELKHIIQRRKRKQP